MFTGRQRDLAVLAAQAVEVERTGRGVMLAIRGRRQVGKSRLVEEFCARANLPSVSFVAARRQDPTEALADFADLSLHSTLPNAASAEAGFRSWPQALEAITADITRPVVVVLDEFPWMIEADVALEGLLQRSWDRVLSRRPILLILVGSDLAMMDALTDHDRPLFDRVRPMHIDPLDPAAVGELAGLDATRAFEAYAITGGFPNVVLRWRDGETDIEFLTRELQDPLSALVVSGERSINAEFPDDAYARPVLNAIGHGERDFGAIAQRSGLGGSSLERALNQLLAKQVIVRDRAYSAAASKVTGYRVGDAYLRFWLRYIGRNLTMIERGAGERAVARVLGDWTHWQGRAIEPIVREAVLRRVLHDGTVPEAAEIGRWWKRDNSIEVDLVVGDRQSVARSIEAVGSIKWHHHAPFDTHDAAELHRARTAIPGTHERTMTIVATKTPMGTLGIDLVYRPNDLLDTWRQA